MKINTLLFFILFHFSTISGLATDEKPGFGVGAFPLSDSMVSMWILKKNENGAPEAVAVVYFTGRDGWHNHPWESKFEGNIKREGKIFYQLVSDKITLEISISEDGDSVAVMGEEFKLTNYNVFVVRDVDPQNHDQKVVGIGKFELPNPNRRPVSVVLLEESPELRLQVY